MSKKVMRLIDPKTGRMECKVCGSEHYANIRPCSDGHYYRGSWQCQYGCKLEDLKATEESNVNDNETHNEGGCEFAMSVNAHTQGGGCPTCAAEKNSAGSDDGIQIVINYLRKLAEAERLLVWDPASKNCLSGQDIENICANGNGVQISLSRTALVEK